jgi:hypothetical protein
MAKSIQKDARPKTRAGSTATRRTRAPRKRVAKNKTAAGTAAARRPARKRAPKPVFTESDRRRMVAEAAYYLAEKRGFAPGDPMEDWIAAEAQIDAKLSRGKPR